MTDLEIKNYRFKSGLTYTEADALVDRLTAGYGDDKDFVIHMLKTHLSRAVRDYKLEREIVSACAAG